MIPRLGRMAVVLLALSACTKEASRDPDTVQRRFGSTMGPRVVLDVKPEVEME